MMAGPTATSGDGTIRTIGDRLRRLREQRGWSVRDAARRSRLSASFIGLVERGESEIAVTRLMRLADVYAVTVGDLLGDLQELRSRHCVPLSEARVVDDDDGRVTISYLPVPMRGLQPFRLLLRPGGTMRGLSHATEEFHHCVEGAAMVTIDGVQHAVAVGDTVHVPSQKAHEWHNPHDVPCLIVGGVGRDGTGL
uniref:helix-turn-helix domain-containing protein n=1 Tax=Nonomuraea pusilla TaxID=46177 RepID=UPI0006E27783|nr:XRE family transcriptional regulator [Nonomuraea pusilla]